MNTTETAIAQMPEVSKCKTCGETDYQIQLVYQSGRDKLFAVECYRCKSNYGGHIIPVVIDYVANLQEVNDACLSAWNEWNAKP